MQYNLLLTNCRRVRWLWWGLLAYVVGGVGLLAIGFSVSFAFLMAPMITLLIAFLFYNQLFRQLSWVLVSPDGIAWAHPVSNSPVSWKFEEIRSYRFEFYRNGIKLFLYTQTGQRIVLDAKFSLEYGAMQQAFEQAVRCHNRAHPGAEVRIEKDSLEKFFEHSISTKVLIGLLSISAAWIIRCLERETSGLAYLPLLLLLPYLAIWANFYYQRP
jgi:hypothetical protein